VSERDGLKGSSSKLWLWFGLSGLRDVPASRRDGVGRKFFPSPSFIKPFVIFINPFELFIKPSRLFIKPSRFLINSSCFLNFACHLFINASHFLIKPFRLFINDSEFLTKYSCLSTIYLGIITNLIRKNSISGVRNSNSGARN
jgi:hypothetical protein